MLALLLLAVTVFLAYANGANDNFKGVATLYGSGTLSYRQALSLATIAQVAGSVASVFLAAALVKAFSGKGLVAPEISSSREFLISIGIGASATVMLATLIGFPISTTHALTGALAGAAFIANGGSLDVGTLSKIYFLPLLLSPLLAVATTAPLYLLAHQFSQKFQLKADSCICLETEQPIPVTAGKSVVGADRVATPGAIRVATIEDCEKESYHGQIIGISAQTIVDYLHVVSAFALCFARGLNDTPKIVGVIFAANAFSIEVSLVAIAVAMAAGGWLQSVKVAECMSKKITPMNDGQALTANLVASFYVIAASRFGVPVSTTHITVGAISGVGIVSGSANIAVIRDILLSWVLTLPIAAMIGIVSLSAFNIFGA